MRKIGVTSGIIALVAVIFSPLPTAAFGIHVGPFYFHFPLAWHHRHHLYLRTNPNEARTRRNEANVARTEPTDRESRTETSIEVLESCPGVAPDVTNPPVDQIRKTVLRRLTRKRLSTILAQHRRKQAISSNRHVQRRFRLHRLAESMQLSSD